MTTKTKLDEISVRTGMSKSTIIEAISEYFKKDKVSEARIKDIDENGDKALLDLKNIKPLKDNK